VTPESAEQELAKILEPGERLHWSGVPPQGLLLRGSDAFFIPFSIMWGGFAIFWETMAWTKQTPLLFKLWGIPFVLVGLYILVGRFFVDAKMRSRMAYGVTDRRIIIRSGILSRNVNSLALKTLSDLTLTERSDGTGTITFGPSYPMAYWHRGGFWPGMGGYPMAPSFESIPRAKDVYATIRQVQSAG